MAYTRVNWENSPSVATPISAENLNVMDAGISALDTSVTALESTSTDIEDSIGTLSSLTTTVKTDLVSAINEVDANTDTNASSISSLGASVTGNTTSIGTLANLTTTEKTNLVGAVNELKEDLGDMTSVDFTTVDGFVSATGSISTDSTTSNYTKTTESLYFAPNTTIKFDLTLTTSKTEWIAYGLYDIEGAFISRTVLSNASGTSWSYEVTMPDEAYYIRFSYRSFNIATVTISASCNLMERFQGIDEDIADVEASTILAERGSINSQVTMTSNYYLNNTGGITYTSGAIVSGLIKVNPFEHYTLTLLTSGTLWMAYGFFDSSGTFITRVVNSTASSEDDGVYTLKQTFTIPIDGSVAYIRVSFGTGYTSYSIDKEANEPKTYNVKSVNHRGYQADAPENTLPAFRLSKLNGFDWVEADVQFTSDDVPVILHDESINRTARYTDGTELESTVNIEDITYAEALTYDFGIWKSSDYAGTNIPTLEEMIALCRNIGLKARIELKTETVTTDKISAIVDIIKAYGMIDNVEWSSFGLSLLQYIATNYPTFDLCYIVSAVSTTVVTDSLALKTDYNNVCVATTRTDTDDNIALLADADIPCDFYTITSEDQVISANPYVSSFTTNSPNAGRALYDANIT